MQVFKHRVLFTADGLGTVHKATFSQLLYSQLLLLQKQGKTSSQTAPQNNEFSDAESAKKNNRFMEFAVCWLQENHLQLESSEDVCVLNSQHAS